MNGGANGSGARKFAATWPCRWSTAASGSRRAPARPFAVATPISSAPTSPGPWVTADQLDVVQRRARRARARRPRPR